ncbi:hypothetical protein [uncultured Sanguibacteroides sp.]|uniref:hypothetical protein n=1 Tax=uncultured Sanguibacteroides sp. TaxID=1635151 RepID=UPI0025EFD5A1|nr:hypothetical protein [uncultured Sanguibacteroides sp.]
MKKYRINIPALLLLFTFLLATVGINVIKIQCFGCRMAYVEVQIFPNEDISLCENDCCSSSCKNPQKSACEQENAEHDFYKLSGDWAVSHMEFQCLDAQDWKDEVCFVPPITGIVSCSSDIDLSFLNDFRPPELLCIFRC